MATLFHHGHRLPARRIETVQDRFDGDRGGALDSPG
jgi:hypothetical protein